MSIGYGENLTNVTWNLVNHDFQGASLFDAVLSSANDLIVNNTDAIKVRVSGGITHEDDVEMHFGDSGDYSIDYQSSNDELVIRNDANDFLIGISDSDVEMRDMNLDLRLGNITSSNITSSYRSSDGSQGLTSTECFNVSHAFVIKDGLITSIQEGC
jgi:hypothetical protein